ncbi:acyl carrier protein [Paenibacillus sp. SYP-B3998]|uniref:Acyl carrier protein n=1 Tax=Paenibacillus sp. SYP-B3998 TaxID=2678564 RepID=A0A6G3ZW45_9BACL|nr:acyl carrier protein [Paenibacillus sp. SYP-B3998]NEW06268.1 acyl carrier protein [Paenibacillus sp. SYP-B3998]
MNDVKQVIREVLQELAAGIETNELSDDTLLADLGIDSIKYVELLVQIEEKCNIIFDESDLGVESLRNFGDLAALVNKSIVSGQVN